MSGNVIDMLALVAEADRRDLLSLGGKELAAELSRRRKVVQKALDEEMVKAIAHRDAVEAEYAEKGPQK